MIFKQVFDQKSSTYTYLIASAEGREALIIDPVLENVDDYIKLLDEFNLQHLRNLNASVLSGGEIRRLMMARLMINKPKIVLLDEPLAALDPIVIQDIQKYILKIQASGTAVLVTDHNVKNLFDITDRSYVLGEHTVIAEGTSRELLRSSRAVKYYFGSQFS